MTDTTSEYQKIIHDLAKSVAIITMHLTEALNAVTNRMLGESLQATDHWMARSLEREDFREGAGSFIEERAPEFKRVTG